MPASIQPSNSDSAQAELGPVSVHQAIFTSARTSRLDGYQLVSVSTGVTDEDSRALAAWGPAHDALIQDADHETSTNFHPLGPNKFCISRTMLGGAEYSGRRGRRVYTHSLIVKAQDFVRFHNNPFELLVAALAMGDVKPRDNYPDDLPVLQLWPTGQAVNGQMIAEDRGDVTVRQLVAWFHEALTRDRLVISGYQEDQIFNRFFNLLPVGVRPWFSFSTRLKFSTRRQFRIIGLPGDVEQQKRAIRQDGLSHLNLTSPPQSAEVDRHPWASLVQVAMRVHSVETVAEAIGGLPLNLSPQDLCEEGNRLKMQLVRGGLMAPPENAPPEPSVDAVAGESTGETFKETAEPPPADPPKIDLPGLLAKIDAALEGKIEDLASLQQEWKSMQAEVEEPNLAELQAACHEHTTARWEALRQQEPCEGCSDALDILCLIFGINRMR